MNERYDDATLLIDHANIRDRGEMVAATLKACSASDVNHRRRARALVRLYGGWYDRYTATTQRGEAYNYYSQFAPAVLRMGRITWNTRLELAETIALADPCLPRISHTVATRHDIPRFGNNRSAEECTHHSCAIAETRKWLRKRRGCTAVACPTDFSDRHVYREQKQVDTHITTDLLLYSQFMKTDQFLAICSNDWDMIPAILAASAVDARPHIIWVRHGGEPTYIDGFLEQLRDFSICIV